MVQQKPPVAGYPYIFREPPLSQPPPLRPITRVDATTIASEDIMTTAIFFTLFALACALAPIAGADSRPFEARARRWWPGSPR